MMGYQDEWMKYELMAIQRSSHLQVIGGGLLTTVKLAQSLAYMKLCLGNLPLSIQLGKSAFIIYCEEKVSVLRERHLIHLFSPQAIELMKCVCV